MEYDIILQRVKESYSKLLGSNLVGIYVHGSIAFGCFNWDKSDIDCLVVVNNAIPLDIKRGLMDETLRINANAPPKGLEMSVVLKEHCVNFKYPTPFDLHYSNAHKDWYERNPNAYCKKMNGVDIDLGAHFMIIKKAGIALCGEPVEAVFGDVPAASYLDSIKRDIENAKDEITRDPVYMILNLCRVLAYKRDGLILSKEQGGNWGLENADSKFNALIKAASEHYSSDTPAAEADDITLEFCEYMLEHIFEKET